MKIPLHISEVPSEVWYAGTDREIRGQPLCDIGGDAKVGVGYLERRGRTRNLRLAMRHMPVI